MLFRSHENVHVQMNKNALEITDLLDKCTDAFVSASTVLFEAYARGLNCFAGHYSNNQKYIYSGFVKEDRAIGLGDLKNMKELDLDEIFDTKAPCQTITGPLTSGGRLRELFMGL